MYYLWIPYPRRTARERVNRRYGSSGTAIHPLSRDREGTGRGRGEDGEGRVGTGRDGDGRDGEGRDGEGRDGDREGRCRARKNGPAPKGRPVLREAVKR
ncbi:hypothetical protein E3T55_00140 [Cryobacterium frigoriphilum]|uniref:Uncharacterized protein n=1 Tax=Cryobacterium frigoriphilum TaxID=1259150 RepID=A0A4V3IS80_9MICO|nr:hypothetical protein E3T55_00140 [Cryobacterium frigoriphilum]